MLQQAFHNLLPLVRLKQANNDARLFGVVVSQI
jgi:hypothetical protein